MRGLVVLGIVVALIVAMAMALLSQPSDEELAPPSAGPAVGPTPGEDPASGDALTAERIRMDPLQPPDDAALPPDAPPAAEDSLPSTAAPGSIPVALEVWNAATREPVPQFRYVLELADGNRRAAVVPGFQLELALDPAGLPAVLTVEGAGFEPAEPVTLRGAGMKDGLPRRIWLTPAAAFAGVEFWVQTAAGAPVEILDVTALREDPADPSRPGKFLWRRQASEPDGVYRLPEVEPGRYIFELREVDADGRSTPHLGHQARVTFHGTENVRTNVRLEIGGQIDLRVTDVDGTPIADDVALRLRQADGTARRTTWTGQDDGDAADGIDLLPGGAGRSEAVAPGIYRLAARHDDRTIEQEVVVTAGQVTEVTLQL